MNFGTGDFTISAWINCTSLSENNLNTIVQKREVGGSGKGYWLQINSSSLIKLYIRDGDADVYEIKGSTNIVDSNWHHIVGVFDEDNASNCKVYLDGNDNTSTRTGTLASIGDINNTDVFKIGESSEANWRRMVGQISGVKIWDRELSTSEIELLYDREKGAY